MSENTKIEWATHTFNPWEGCQKVGPGCDHCYAETRNARFAGGTAINWGPGAPRRRTSAANWVKPLAWNADHDAYFAKHGHRQRVFCASLADVFDNAVDPQWRADLFALIQATPNLDWLLLTKRIGNVPAMVSIIPGWLPSNVWLGATIVNQEEADRDIPKLLAVPATKRFLSMEPLLGPVDLAHLNDGKEVNEFSCLKPYTWEEEIEQWRRTSDQWEEEFSDWYNIELSAATGPLHNTVDWVIVGGESGPGARPMHPDWARSLRDQCAVAAVPYLFKQWGEWVDADNGPRNDTFYNGKTDCWAHIEGGHHDGAMGVDFFNTYPMYRVGKKAAGRLLDGRTWDGVPA